MFFSENVVVGCSGISWIPSKWKSPDVNAPAIFSVMISNLSSKTSIKKARKTVHTPLHMWVCRFGYRPKTSGSSMFSLIDVLRSSLLVTILLEICGTVAKTHREGIFLQDKRFFRILITKTLCTNFFARECEKYRWRCGGSDNGTWHVWSM